MSDLDTIKAMLERANIKCTVDPLDEDGPNRDMPAGGMSLRVGGPPGSPYGYVEQPHEGGYIGFFTEIVFDADGNLCAVWAWE